MGSDSREIGVQQVARHLCQHLFRIEAALRRLECALAYIAAYNVDVPTCISLDALADGNCDFVGLFTGGAPSAPHSQTPRTMLRLPAAEFRQHNPTKRRKCRGAASTGDGC